MVVTKDDIINGLVKLGLGNGDLVTLHSSLKSLGHVEGGGQTVIRALLETLGPQGTILMPAFSFPLKSQDEPIFDVRETPSCVGLITEIFRREYATSRSIHLSHSYSAAGPLAAELTIHRLDITPCGKDSPLGKFMDRDGKILLLGVGYNSCTAFHVVEERMKAPYMIFQANPKAKYRINGEVFPLPSKILGKTFSYDFTMMEREFRAQGIIQVGKIGGATASMLSSRSFMECVERRLKNDPGCFFRGFNQ
jgi:aminoglycoside 3-N-acetyltransferase